MKLEDQINRHRSQYDDLEKVPEDAIWQAISEQRKGKQGKRTTLIRYAIAASLAALLTVPFLIQTENKGTQEDPLSDYPEFNQQERYYYQLAADKKSELEFDKLNKETYGDLIDELRNIDSMYTELKGEIAQIPNAEKAIQTAIKFHERRLHILELLEREIQNQKRAEDNESTIKI